MAETRDGTGRKAKRSVSVAVEAPGGSGRVVVVRRPDDDPDLPGIWGLPAATLREGEGWEDAARRAAREKLGVEIAGIRELGRGRLERDRYTLVMRLYSAGLDRGTPRVPRPHPEVTQYVEWRAGGAEDLRPGADAGSLCCRLYLEASGEG